MRFSISLICSTCPPHRRLVGNLREISTVWRRFFKSDIFWESGVEYPRYAIGTRAVSGLPDFGGVAVVAGYLSKIWGIVTDERLMKI